MKNIEHFLKRNLKRRLKITQSLVVTFLIMGTVLQAAPQEDPREEKKVLIFMNGMIQDGGGSGSHQKVSKRNKKPDRPIVKPITPEVDPQRPIDGFDPITPEVDPVSIIIWENGGDIEGDVYNLTTDLVTSGEYDGLRTIGGTINNQATIKVIDYGHYGMKVESGLGINEGTIEAYKGILLDKGEVINKGLITLKRGTGDTQIGMGGENTSINETADLINEETGEIIIETGISGDAWGMRAIHSNSNIINKGKIAIKNENIGSNSYGIDVRDGAVAINEESGEITVDNISNSANGMIATTESNVINKGKITLSVPGTAPDYGMNITGMIAESGGVAVNEETGEIIMGSGVPRNTYGMKGGVDSTIINKGKITLTSENKGDASYGIYAENGAVATNESTGTLLINSNSRLSNGMIATSKESIVTNKGAITLLGSNGFSEGMKATDGGVAINEETGSIVLNGGYEVSYGMEAINSDGSHGSESSVINKGEIVLKGKNEEGSLYGMVTSGTAINEETGKIIIENGLHNDIGGMVASYGGNVINKGEIIALADDSIGIKLDQGIGTNDTSGRINLDGRSVTGVSLKGVDSVFDNKGTINLNGDNGIGMLMNDHSTGINNGVINVNGDNGTGMRIRNYSTGINNGTINLNGNDGIGIYVGRTSILENNGIINIASGTTGNREIYTEDGATIINAGKVIAEGEFDTSKVGEGQFVMSAGGTLEADSIKGDIRTSGALARGGFEDTYSTYKMLKTNNLEGNVISNSAMFDAKVTENADENGYYDVELIRKDFNSLMANGEIGEILEENYKDTGNELKEDYYDALKLLSTNKQLAEAANDTFGIGYFEGLAKQSLDTVKTTRNVIKNNIFTEAGNRTVGDVIAIGGMDASTIELDSSGNFIGYDYDLYSIYFGVDKQIASEWRVGAVGTIGKGEADYDNANDKSDDIYQGTFYALYESDFKVNTMLYLGQIDSDLERNVNFADWNKKYEDNVDTKYIGLDTAISKRYNLNNFYIEPKAELNTTYFKQDRVHELGEGGVSIDSQDYYSIETGIGGAIGRSFLQEKLAIEGSLMFYTELGDPYKDQESKVNDLFEGDKVKINSYQGNDYYADLGLDMSYKVTEPLKINLGGSYITGEEEDNWNINLGLRYVM